jgi:hypothetical protein
MEDIEKKTWENLKEFDPTADSIKTDKHNYRILTSNISVERYLAMEMWELILLGYQSHRDYAEYQAELLKNFNEGNQAMLGKLIIDGQMMFGFQKQKVHPVLMFCMIFVVREDEDIMTWDEDVAKEKIKDLVNHGYGMPSFFALCLRVSPTLKKGYKDFTQSILADRKENTLPKK